MYQYLYRTIAVLLFAALAFGQLVDPGLPVGNSATPGWFHSDFDQYTAEYQTFRSSPSLPSNVDVTIIGGGFAGVSIAYYLSLLAPQLKVALVDARGIASGASGRNLGWMAPQSHNNFLSTVAKIGLPLTKAQIDFEEDVAENLHTLALAFGWTDVTELEKSGKYYIYRDQARWNATVADIEAYRAAGYTDVTTLTAEQCNREFGITNAVGCSKSSKAFKIRSAAYVWKLLGLTLKLNRNLNVQTNTPVTSVTKIEGAAAPLLPNLPVLLQPFRAAQYKVATSRGTINTNTVVYATDGWTSHLLKKLQYGGSNANTLWPVSQPIIQTNIKFPREHKAGIEFAPNQYGVGHRSTGGYIVAQGHNRFISNDAYNATFDQPFFDDSLNFARTVFPKDNTLTIAHQWTGIQGYTSTGFPYTGPINGKGANKLISHQWIAAGFNGHGNPRVFGACRAVVKEMLFGVVEPGYPTMYQTNLMSSFDV